MVRILTTVKVPHDIINSVTWNPGGPVTGDDYEWMTKNTHGTYSVMTGLPTNVG